MTTEKIVFMIDCSAIQSMFEGKQSGDKLLEKFNQIKYEGKEVRGVTTQASFLRAIYLSNPETKIQTIQKTLNFLEVVPSFADFKDENAVIEEILKLANFLGKKSKGV